MLRCRRIFENHNGLGGKKTASHQRLKALQGKSAPIGRVEKNQIKFYRRLHCGQKSKTPGQILIQHRGAVGKTAERNIFANKLRHRALAIDKNRQRRPPTQGLKPQSASAGKKIQDFRADNLSGENAEDCLPGPVGGGTNQVAKTLARCQQLAPPSAAADDPHLLQIIPDEFFGNLHRVERSTFEDVI